MESKHLFNCIIGFVLLFGCEGNISDQRLCGDPTCSDAVSYATTLIKYSSDDARILSFPANAKVKVFSKSAGTRDDLWGVEINGRRGYAPKSFLREHRILKSKLDHLVLTETEDEYDLAPAEDAQETQETQVVDGTTFFMDRSTSSADETKSLHLPDSSTESIAQVSSVNSIDPFTVPSQVDTVMPNVVESEPPIHSTEIPSVPDSTSSTQVPSFSQSEPFSESSSVQNPVVPTLASTDSNLGTVEHPKQSISSPGLVDPLPINSPSDPIEPTLIQVEAPVQPITTDHVDIPLESAKPTLIDPEPPAPIVVPILDAPPEDVEEPQTSQEDQEEDDENDDDNDYFEEEEGSAKGLYQYISSFYGKDEPIPEDNIVDASSNQNDSLEEISREPVGPEAFGEEENDNASKPDMQNEETSPANPENADNSVSIDAIPQNSDSSVLTEMTSKTLESLVLKETLTSYTSSPVLEETLTSYTPSPVLEETLTSYTASPVLAETASENTDSSVLVEPTTVTMKADDWTIESPEGNQDSTPLEDYTENTPDEAPSVAVAENDEITNETEELPRGEAFGENLAFLKKPSINSAEDILDESNEEVPEDLSPSFFSLVSNYLSGLSNPFAKSESALENVDESLEPLSQETCSSESAARNCDSTASAPLDSAYEIPYEMGSAKGIFEETDSVKVYYLIITAVTVLLFSLGHYFIENLRHDAKYAAAISKLQKELMISAAEVSSARAELEAFQNGETVVTSDDTVVAQQTEAAELTEKLAESQNVCAELEEQVACLQSELETATETGLELNRMLSEYLATQHDSENDPLKSRVEDLQIQLNSQQGLILSMNELLAAKDAEIEALIEKTDELASIHLEIANLAEQAEEREASLTQLKYDLVVRDKEMSVAQECITQMSGTTPGQEDIDVLHDILDVAKVRADLQIVTEERDLLRSQFEEEMNTRKMLEDHRSVIQEQITMLQEACQAAVLEKTEAKTKLQVLSNYFKEKEAQHQKELITREATCLRQAGELTGDEITSLQEQISNYRTQNETLKREILDQERDFKDQIASLELKVHENWVAARQAERRSDELKQDAATLRNLLTIAEKQSTKQMGDRLPSPLHASMPDCPPLAVMPPCLFPAPGSPHDRRPPPLGCMSSPPLLPPARYHHGFRPLSAPKGSNHSSGHSSGSIEKYNNQV